MAEAPRNQEERAELKRYGITATRTFGVTVGEVKAYARQIGTDHALGD